MTLGAMFVGCHGLNPSPYRAFRMSGRPAPEDHMPLMLYSEKSVTATTNNAAVCP